MWTDRTGRSRDWYGLAGIHLDRTHVSVMSIEDERFEVAAAGKTAQQAGALLRGTTLLVPCVSIGSVPQLAVDALLASPGTAVTTQEPIHVCDLDHRFCMPFAGAGAAASPSSAVAALRTPLQVFAFPSARLTVIQQRSPILKVRSGSFFSLALRRPAWHAADGSNVLTIWLASLASDRRARPTTSRLCSGGRVHEGFARWSS